MGRLICQPPHRPTPAFKRTASEGPSRSYETVRIGANLGPGYADDPPRASGPARAACCAPARCVSHAGRLALLFLSLASARRRSSTRLRNPRGHQGRAPLTRRFGFTGEERAARLADEDGEPTINPRHPRSRAACGARGVGIPRPGAASSARGRGCDRPSRQAGGTRGHA